jgi:hypothetical protein
MTAEDDTVTLWRPTGLEELALVEASGWREWPPRLTGQPIFYPVLNEEYATMIARDWNVKHSGAPGTSPVSRSGDPSPAAMRFTTWGARPSSNTGSPRKISPH